MILRKNRLPQSESTKHDLWIKVQSLQEERDKMFDFKRKLELSENEKDLVSKKLLALEDQLKVTVAQNSTIKLNMDSMKEALDDLKKGNKDSENAYSLLEHSAMKDKAELTDIKDSKRILLEKLGSIESQLEIANSAKGKMESDIALKDKTFKSMSDENARIKDAILEIEEKARPNQELLKNIDNLKEERDRYLQRVKSLEDEISTQEAYKATLEGNLAGTKKAMGELKFSQDDLKTRLEEKTKRAIEADDFELRIKKLDQEKKDIIADSKELLSQLNVAQEMKSALDSDLAASQKALDEARDGKHRLELRFSPFEENEKIVNEMEEKTFLRQRMIKGKQSPDFLNLRINFQIQL